jgi:hypothetical protein
LALAEAVPEKKGARKEAAKATFLEHVGHTAIGAGDSLGEMLKFLGEMTVTFFRLLRMKVRFRGVDLFLLIQQCGAQALPIVTLISFLVGVILAFVGAVQLKQFGAQIYVADLVGIAIVHEMGAMMTGIIMAGRTGAAFAAQLGTMKVTQEIDAFTTMGFSPLEILGAAARDCVNFDDASVVSLLRLRRCLGRGYGCCRNARSFLDHLRSRDHPCDQFDGSFRRRVQELGLRRADRAIRLFARYSMR